MAIEASEITTATALQYTTTELSKVKDVKKLSSMLKKGSKGTGIIFGSSKEAFIKKLKPTNEGGFSESQLDNMAVGVSAAIGIRTYIKEPNKKLIIYLAGNTWHSKIKQFQVKAFGFDDYNSADLVLTKDEKKYYGISLKKKKNISATDPTLINKAVTTAFDGPEYKDLKDELTNLRINYFIDLVVEAVDEEILLEKDIPNFDVLKKRRKNPKTKNMEYIDHELFYAKKRDRTQFGDKSYIDTKGYATSKKGGYKDSNTDDPKSMRYFVNRKLGEKDPKGKKNINPLYTEYKNVIMEPWMLTKKGKRKGVPNAATILAEHLLNIILKTKLYDQIDLDDKEFDFVLITGIGDVKFNKSNPMGLVSIDVARQDPLKTTLCGLSRIKKEMKTVKYSVVLDKETEQKSDAAKVFFKLMNGNFHIMDVRIRYKGSFNPKPQFQAYMSKDFKTKLDKETCGV